MDLEESWKTATDLLKTSHDVWESPELTAIFPDGIERAASALVATIGVEDVLWVETRSDLSAPKVEAAVFSSDLVAHLMLTGEGFGFDLHRLVVQSVRATSVPYVHPGPDGPTPFRFMARFTDLEVSFPWDPDNTKQDARIPEQFVRLRDKLSRSA
jgi:hypothetical protein